MADDTPTGPALMAPPDQLVNPDGTPAKLAQHVVISDAGPCKKHVKVTVERAAIDARFDEKFSELARSDAAPVVPGFRRGKAPRKIIERSFHKAVAGEVRTEVLMASLEQLAEEQSLSPLSPPDLDLASIVIPETGPFVYEFNIEVRPEFDLPEYKYLKLRRPTHTFTDEDVAKEFKKTLEPHGQLVPKDGDNPVAETDDLITADVAISLDGNLLNTLSEIRVRVEKRLALADGVAANFAEIMTGAKVGDTRTVDITLSQDVTTETLRGTVVQAAFTVKDLKTVRPPELTPELLGKYDVRTPDQFNELIRTRLDRYLEYVQRQSARAQVMKFLATDAKWDLPRDLLTRQARKTLARRVMEMRSSGMSDEQIVGRQRVLEQDAIRSTAAALQEHFVLQKIAEIEKLEIEDQDIEAEIDRLADEAGESPRKMKAKLEKDDLLEALATELLERRALDLVLSTATYEDYPLNPTDADADTAVATSEAQLMPAAAAAVDNG
ncbi:MAG: trigger factor [Fimbriiglobus sp.]